MSTQRTSRDFLLGTCCGTFVLMLSTATLVVIIAACVLYLGDTLQDNSSMVDGSITYGHTLWEAYTYFIDPGTHTGLIMGENHAVDFVAAVITSLLGFGWVLVGFGIIVDRVGLILDGWRRQHAKLVVQGHTLILGWTDKTLFLLGELAQMMHDGPKGGGTLVVLGELDVYEMRDEVRVVYRDFPERFPRVKLHFWQGKPHEVDDLERVSVARASHIIVLGNSRDHRTADSLVISTLCSLRCLPLDTPADNAPAVASRWGGGTPSRGAASEIILEISLPQNVLVAQRLGGGAARTVTAKTAIDELLAIATCTPSVGHPLIELMSFEGAQFEFVNAQRLLGGAAAHGGAACTVGALRRRLAKGILLGLVHQDPRSSLRSMRESSAAPDALPMDAPTMMRPPSLSAIAAAAATKEAGGKSAWKSMRWKMTLGGMPATLQEHTLGRDDDAPHTPTTLPPMSPSSSGTNLSELEARRLRRQMHFAPPDDYIIQPTDLLVVVADSFKDANVLTSNWRQRANRAFGITRANTSKTTRKGDPPTEAADAVAAVAAASGEAMAAGSGAASGKAPRGACILMVGWMLDLRSVLRAFDRRLPPNSTIHIISEKSLEWRRSSLAAEGLSLDGQPIHDEGSAGRTGHVELCHLVGFATDETALRRLPLDDATAAIVSADVDQTEVDTQLTDAEVITSALLLRQLYEARARQRERGAQTDRSGGDGGCASGGGGDAQAAPQPPFPIVIEFNDVLTRRLLTRQPDLLDGATALDDYEQPPYSDGSNLDGLSSTSASAAGATLPPPPRVELFTFHRNYLETTALSMSANSHAHWHIMQALLDAQGQVDLSALPALPMMRALDLEAHASATPRPEKLTALSETSTPHAAVPEMTEPSTAERSAQAEQSTSRSPRFGRSLHALNEPSSATEHDAAEGCWSFEELADAIASRGLGVLIGWRRLTPTPPTAIRKQQSRPDRRVMAASTDAAGIGKPVINPSNRSQKLPWGEGDELLVVQTHQQGSGGGGRRMSTGYV